MAFFTPTQIKFNKYRNYFDINANAYFKTNHILQMWSGDIVTTKFCPDCSTWHRGFHENQFNATFYYHIRLHFWHKKGMEPILRVSMGWNCSFMVSIFLLSVSPWILQLGSLVMSSRTNGDAKGKLNCLLSKLTLERQITKYTRIPWTIQQSLLLLLLSFTELIPHRRCTSIILITHGLIWAGRLCTTTSVDFWIILNKNYHTEFEVIVLDNLQGNARSLLPLKDSS